MFENNKTVHRELRTAFKLTLYMYCLSSIIYIFVHFVKRPNVILSHKQKKKKHFSSQLTTYTNAICNEIALLIFKRFVR